jgi:hypothetical protein
VHAAANQYEGGSMLPMIGRPLPENWLCYLERVSPDKLFTRVSVLPHGGYQHRDVRLSCSFLDDACPIEKFIAVHEIQDSSMVNVRLKSGRDAKIDEPELGRTVSIGANGNSASCFASELQEIQT